jgi:hypothetical protein
MRLIGLAVILTLSVILAPLAAEGQQAVKIPRIGYLSPTSAPAFENAFRQRLRELGYVEGGTSLLSTDGRRESTIGSQSLRPSWSA